VILFGVSVIERAEETGMASLVSPDPVPAVAQLDKRTLPPPIRQEIVDLYAEYAALTTNEWPPDVTMKHPGINKTG
jgi:hypothetical protein